MELEQHWEDVVRGIAEFTGEALDPEDYKVVCIDVLYLGSGDVAGNGATKIYIARQNANHFVPLVFQEESDESDSDFDVSSSREEESEESESDSDGSASRGTVDDSEADACSEAEDDSDASSCSEGEDEARRSAAALQAWKSLESLADAAATETKNDAEAASNASTPESGDEATDDEVLSAYESDASDLFHLDVEPNATWETFQDKDRRVVHLLARQMRRHPLVPPQPNDESASTSFLNVQSGLKLPGAHCAFKGCCWIGDTKDSIEEHLVLCHGAQLQAAEAEVFGEGRQSNYGSSASLCKATSCLNMAQSNRPLRDFFMAYYIQAIAEIERGAVTVEEDNAAKETSHGPIASQGVPVVGPSVDRRTFGHLREVYNDTVICTLICFLCAQRRTHTRHPNSAIQRRSLQLFPTKNSNQPSEEPVLKIDDTRKFLKNLCRKTFLHRFAREGTPLWNAKFLGPMEGGDVVHSTIELPKREQQATVETDSDATSSSDEDPEVAWEWRRLFLCDDGDFLDLICCPEDVMPTEGCKHGNRFGVDDHHIVCKNCTVPICSECYDYITNPPL